MTATIFILNGPNLNRLGKREPGIYGSVTLDQVAENCRKAGGEAGFAIDFRQTNHEGVLIDWVQEATETAAAIIINPGGYTHNSVALHDALRSFGKPIIEVHISNIHAREEFRHRSLVAPVATGTIVGLGPAGYELAITALRQRLHAS